MELLAKSGSDSERGRTGIASRLLLALVVPLASTLSSPFAANDSPAFETTAPTRSFHLRLEGRASWKDVTATLDPTDLVFEVRPDGVLSLPLERLSTNVLLTNGTYRLQVFTREMTKTFALVLDDGSPSALLFSWPPSTSSSARTRSLDTLEARGGDRRRESGMESLTGSEARTLPGSGGDPVKALMNLPGIVPQNFGSQDLLVRGSEGRDSRFYLDGVRIGYPFHDMGFNSVFHPATLESVEFHAGAFSAGLPGGMGGVIDLKGRSQFDKGRPHAEIDANFASASAFLTLPLGPFQLSLSGRRSYYEFYIATVKSIRIPELSNVQKALSAFDAIPFFYDYQIRLDARLDERNRLLLLASGAQDRIKVQTDRFPDLSDGGGAGFALSYEDLTLWNAQGISWIHEGGRFRHRLSVWRYDFTNAENLQSVSLNSGRTVYAGVTLAQSIRFDDAGELSWGAEVLSEEQPFAISLRSNGTQPPGFDFGGLLDGVAPSLGSEPYVARNFLPGRLSVSAFLEADLLLGPFRIRPGLRGTVATNAPPSLDPRLEISWKTKELAEIWLRGGLYSQPAPLFSIASGYGTPGLSNQGSWQIAAGFKLRGSFLEWKNELYFKEMHDLVIGNPTFDVLFPVAADNPRFLGDGAGRSFGWESLLRTRPGSRFQGWLAYTLSRSERTRVLDVPNLYSAQRWSVNDGLLYRNLARSWTPFDQDTTHALTLALNVDLIPKRLRVGTRVVLASGKPYTDLIVTNAGGVLTYAQGPFLGANYPLRFTLDLRLEWMFPLLGGTASIYLDTWNLQFPFRDNVQAWAFAKTSRLDHSMVGQAAPRTPIGDLPLVPLLGLKWEW